MDKDRFNALLADIDQITDDDIKSLNQLRKQYPYFQNQYVMIARALKRRDHPKADAFVKKAAIYSANRGLLKSLILNEHIFAAPAPAEPEPEPEVASKPEPVQPVAEAPVEEKPAKEEKPVNEQPEPPKATAEPEAKEEPVNTEPVETPKPPAVEAPAKPVAAKEHNADTEPKSTEDKDDSDHLISDLEKDLEEIRRKKKLIAKMLEQSEAKEAKAKPEPDKKKPAVSKTHTEKKASRPKKSQSELIEKFIKNEPQMEKQKLADGEGDNPQQDLAARNIKESEDFHTETLAKLMVKQKKYKKAIQIYEKLGLKFPEKRAYFASQIEKVNNRGNV